MIDDLQGQFFRDGSTVANFQEQNFRGRFSGQVVRGSYSGKIFMSKISKSRFPLAGFMEQNPGADYQAQVFQGRFYRGRIFGGSTYCFSPTMPGLQLPP